MAERKPEDLTPLEAYECMLEFLDELYQLTKSDDLASFLGGFQLTKDGGTMDPAAWSDWLKAVRRVKARTK
jgi:hypothetical protein